MERASVDEAYLDITSLVSPHNLPQAYVRTSLELSSVSYPTLLYQVLGSMVDCADLDKGTMLCCCLVRATPPLSSGGISPQRLSLFRS